MEKIQTNTGKNRRLFQITQTRTQHETNTQIYTKISQKNSIYMESKIWYVGEKMRDI